jgi:glucose-1-phosphatase
LESKYKVIVFDLGNVLINFDYNIAGEKINEIIPKDSFGEKNPGDHFLEYYKNNYNVHRKFEKGELGEDAFVRQMLKVLDNKIAGETFRRLYADIFTVNQSVVDLLPGFKKHYRLVLLSNTDPIHRKYGWAHYDFLKYFEKLILSYEVGSVKPEDKIYEAVENYTGCKSGEHFYIDDIPEYVEAAKSRGWDAVQFKGFEELKEELRGREIM